MLTRFYLTRRIAGPGVGLVVEERGPLRRGYVTRVQSRPEARTKLKELTALVMSIDAPKLGPAPAMWSPVDVA